MSVLIKSMEMPESCFNCPFGVSVNFGVLCCPTHTTISDDNLFDADGRELGRQDWCPLIPVPPHGDLIDRDALPKNRVEWEDVVNAPTIIKADESDMDSFVHIFEEDDEDGMDSFIRILKD